MTDGARVLVVDDEPLVRDVLGRYLVREGYEVETAVDGEEAIEAYRERRPDLVVLDLMLPRIDGFEVFRRMRADGPSPVIMLTARGTETDRVVGLELGADDYVAKPFSPSELVARVRAVLRRARQPPPGTSEDALRFDGLEIDPRAREVRVGGRPTSVTPKEFDLIHLLASQPRRVFDRWQLLDHVWDVAFDGDPSTVTVHIRRLREKVEQDPSNPRHLVTVWGAGYRFEP